MLGYVVSFKRTVKDYFVDFMTHDTIQLIDLKIVITLYYENTQPNSIYFYSLFYFFIIFLTLSIVISRWFNYRNQDLFFKFVFPVDAENLPFLCSCQEL